MRVSLFLHCSPSGRRKDHKGSATVIQFFPSTGYVTILPSFIYGFNLTFNHWHIACFVCFFFFFGFFFDSAPWVHIYYLKFPIQI